MKRTKIQSIPYSVKILNILAALGAFLTVRPFTNWISNLITPWHTSNAPTNAFYPHPDWNTIVYALISAPLWEEAVFRHFPLQAMKLLKPDIRSKLLLPTIILSSCIWGIIHQGVPSIWQQGVAGLIYSWLYIQNGYDIKSTLILHFMWNFYTYSGVIYLA